MTEPAHILAEALKLDSLQRTHLVEALAASLDGAEFNDEWEREIQLRIEDLESGRVKAVPGEEVLARLERQFSARWRFHLPSRSEGGV